MTALVPQNDLAIERFGKGDRQKLRSYLVMLTAFLEGKPDNTRRTYKTAIGQFFNLFEWICPEDVTPAHVAAFKKYLLTHKQLAESTTYCRISAMSSLFDFLCMPPSPNEEPLLRSNPFKLIPRNDIQPTPYGRARPMSWEAFRTILDHVPSNMMGMRDKAILLFFAFTGRRRSEVANLKIRDLNLSSRPRTYTCKVKGGRLKTFELPGICYDAIRAYWIIADRLEDLSPDAGVFTAVRETPMNRHLDPDKPLSVRTINQILRRCVIRAGLNPEDEAIGIHAMRHMTARDLDKAGVRLQDIQAFLGHASPLTTQIYLKQLSGPASAHTDVLMKVRQQAEELAREMVQTES